MSIEACDKQDLAILTDAKGDKLSLRDLLARFRQVESMRISDLHLKVNSPPAYRVDGRLEPMDAPPLDKPTMETLVEAVLDSAQIEDLQLNRELDSSFSVDGARFRLNCFYDEYGPVIAVRSVLQQVPEVEEIGFPNKAWSDIVDQESGLIIVTGTCGSGKSTTICSLLERIAATKPCRIITLEDPIEYRLKPSRSLVSQRELGRDVLDYGHGVKASLREDPDVIFVGEMRDRDSAAWTLTAAETGHLVFSTLHTRDVRGTLTRIIDMFPSGQQDEVTNQLSLGLSHVISQKLLPRADGKGRVVAMEIMKNNYAVGNIIRQRKVEQLYNTLQTHTKDNPEERMTTMERTLASLVCRKMITVEEAERHANHLEEVRQELANLRSGAHPHPHHNRRFDDKPE